MQIGFHFDADHEDIDPVYGDAIVDNFFSVLAPLSGTGFSTKMFAGDLRLNSLATEWKEAGASMTGTFAARKYLDDFASWLAPTSLGSARFSLESILRCIHRNIHVIYLDNISSRIADGVNRELKSLPYYLGASEVDESFPVHRVLYSSSLLPLCRITETTVSIFCEGFEGEDLDQLLVEHCKRAGFTDVRYEILSKIVFID